MMSQLKLMIRLQVLSVKAKIKLKMSLCIFRSFVFSEWNTWREVTVRKNGLYFDQMDLQGGFFWFDQHWNIFIQIDSLDIEVSPGDLCFSDILSFYRFSISDIISDILLFIGYSKIATVLKTVPLKNDSTILNTTGRECTLIDEKDDYYAFSCEEHDPYFATLTLLFVFLPSLNVIATLYGPRTTGPIGFVWGIVMVIVGLISFIVGVITSTGLAFVMGWFLFSLGRAMIGLGLVMLYTRKQTPKEQEKNRKMSSKERVLSLFLPCITSYSLLLPLLLPFSPLIFILMKGLAVVKPKNLLLKSQSTIGSRGHLPRH